MKIVADREILLDRLSKAVKFVPSKTVIPVLDNFKIFIFGNRMDIIASNSNLQFKISCPIESDTEDVLCVPAKVFVKLIGQMRENVVKISRKKANSIEIKCGKAKYNLGLNAAPDDFQPMVVDKIVSEINMEQFMIKMALKSAEKFVNEDHANANFIGVNIVNIGNKMVFTGLDGALVCRCAVKPISMVNEWQGVVIPTETAKAVAANVADQGEIAIVHNGEKIRFFVNDDSDSGFEITSVLANAKFPNSEQFFEKMPDRHMIINTLELADALKRLKLFSSEAMSYRFEMQTNPENSQEIVLTAHDEMTGRDGMEVLSVNNVTLDSINKAFSAEMQLKILSIIDTNEFVFYHTEKHNIPCIIEPKVNSDMEKFFSFCTTSMVK